jgi:hypothetical protein
MERPLFPVWSNTVYWVAIALVAGAVVGGPLLLLAWARTPYATGVAQPVDQPVKFDHRHHVRDDGIDCLYCHENATKGPNAGVPPTARCMNCHGQVWTQSPEVARVRESYFSGQPIAWRRVNTLPDFVFFDHSVHTTRGIGCVSCHGRVDLMGQVYQAKGLDMSWCLGCHRDPAKELRPLDKITDMEWQPEREGLGRALAEKYGTRRITDCSGCHR